MDKSNLVRYIENKQLNQAAIDHYLSISTKANHWSNFGPLSRLMESRISELLDLNEDLRVVACCNATMALHALIMMQRSLQQRTLSWVTSAFGFYSSIDGVLARAEILDCDKQAMMDLSILANKKTDGIVVTNIFGQAADMAKYKHHAEQNQQILIIDSAMGFQKGGHIANECISMHHTKPWGFGECGCAIVHKDHEKLFRSIISFGHDSKSDPINRYAMNGKASDIACAYVLMQLDQYDTLKESYNSQYERISKIALSCGFNILGDVLEHPGIPANVPLLLPAPKDEIVKVTIPVGRYYHPLSTDCPQANSIYKRIVNIPCHRDMAKLTDSEIRSDLYKILSS